MLRRLRLHLTGSYRTSVSELAAPSGEAADCDQLNTLTSTSLGYYTLTEI